MENQSKQKQELYKAAFSKDFGVFVTIVGAWFIEGQYHDKWLFAANLTTKEGRTFERFLFWEKELEQFID